MTPSTRDNVRVQKKQILDGDQVGKGGPLYVEDFDTGIGSAGGRLVDILMYGAQQRMLKLEPEAIPGMC